MTYVLTAIDATSPFLSRFQQSITTMPLKMWSSPFRSETQFTSWRCMRVSLDGLLPDGAKGKNSGSYLLIRHLEPTSTCFTSWRGAGGNPGRTYYTISYSGRFQNSQQSTWVQTCPDTRIKVCEYVGSNHWVQRIRHSPGLGETHGTQGWRERHGSRLSGSFYSALNVARLGEKWGRDFLGLPRFLQRIRSGLQLIQKAYWYISCN